MHVDIESLHDNLLLPPWEPVRQRRETTGGHASDGPLPLGESSLLNADSKHYADAGPCDWLRRHLFHIMPCA